MKMTWRLWILGIFLVISIISIVNIGPQLKFLVFIGMLAILFVLTFVKSSKAQLAIVLLLLVICSYLIYTGTSEGVIIDSVDADSVAFEQGLRQGQIITSINEREILTSQTYAEVMNDLFPSQDQVRVDIVTSDSVTHILFINQTPSIEVSDIERTAIKTGLDISGGARALVSPQGDISQSQLDELIEVSRNRFNVFGLSDVNIRGVTDLAGNKFMLVEVAGAKPDDLENLISQQGKFEAKINNQTVFVGGDKDITSVCRNDATCASITGCFDQQGGSICNFAFSITLSADAAQKHADITKEIPLDPNSGGQYLIANLSLILDDELVDELLISSGLKGQVTSQIQIQGSGQGANQEEAFANAQIEMHRLQTILITGSLPFKLEIVKLDSISPLLGEQFVNLVLLAGVAAMLVVAIVVFARYRKINLSLAILLTSFSELIIILGIASLIKWNLDLPSIAGILATIGTGVDQQIVILDEARSKSEVSISRRIKRALFVVMSAYLTSMVALLPLYWAGAGLFKGFALTTIIGITAGVFITRPAFADILKKFEK